MIFGLTHAEKAEIGDAIARLETLSTEVAIRGPDVLKPLARIDEFEPGVWWSGADTVVIEPIDDLVRRAVERGDTYVQTAHASALGLAFQAVGSVVFELSAYDAGSKYDLWPNMAHDCSRATLRADLTDVAVCQEAFWAAIRVLRRWKSDGIGQQPMFANPELEPTAEEDAGSLWFAYGEFLTSTWHQIAPTALYVSRASVGGWKLDEGGSTAVPESAARLEGIVLLVSDSEERRLEEAVSARLPNLRRVQAIARLNDRVSETTFLFASTAEPRAVQRPPVSPHVPDTSLPFFTYGLFMPGQLGYERLTPYVRKRAKEASVSGVLWERDGVPLLEINRDGGRVHGALLEFKKGLAESAYERIDRIEPSSQYRWKVCDADVSGEVVRANVLAGYKPQRGGRRLADVGWDGRKDPFFTKALEIVERDLASAHDAQMGPPFDPEPLLRLQMAYALLWASVERFCALRYSLSADESVSQRIALIGDEPAFVSALTLQPAANLQELRQIYRSDRPSEGPRKITQENELNAGATIRHLYQMRSNILHRGKESLSDFKMLLAATELLLTAFRSVLEDTFARCAAEV